MTKAPLSISRALISVSDKTGLNALGSSLAKHGVEIISTGGTAAALRESGVEVSDVSDLTGFPEIMAGRVKTLHPKVHGGILARRGTDEAVMAKHGIAAIDLVVVNLYPFEQTITKTDCSYADAVENIDIGGPAMLRAAAKNHDSVVVVVDPADYDQVLGEISSAGGTSFATRQYLAAKAYAHTARYDGLIANYLGLQANSESKYPDHFSFQVRKKLDLRYGENPHQSAAFYVEKQALSGTVAHAKSVQGKPLSYNNIADADAALECVSSFAEHTACVIVKHANPCGVAIGSDVMNAYDRAYATDPTSAFGGIIAFNRALDANTLAAILERQFVEVLIAPSFQSGAIEAAKAKPNVRLLECGALGSGASGYDFKRVNSGLLVQNQDQGMVVTSDLKVVSSKKPDDAQMKDLLFAWKVAKFVKSNAIVYVRDQQTIGIGAGQMSRVISARIAAMKAKDEGLEVAGSVLASDAFFPFRDGVDAAAEAGIVAMIQPGGSMRDEQVIAAANEQGIAMVFTGMRHFRH